MDNKNGQDRQKQKEYKQNWEDALQFLIKILPKPIA
jgi:hypothetical protein